MNTAGRSTSNGLRSIATIGLAAAGVFGGHVLVYRFVVDRHEHPWLLDVAHGYLPFAGFAVAVLGFLALVAGVGAGYTSGRTQALGVSSAMRRLVPAQCAAFFSLEVLERLAVDAPMSDLTSVIGVGLLVQIAVALLAALCLAGLHVVGAFVARSPRRRAPASIRRPRLRPQAPRLRRLVIPVAGRAPPAAPAV